MWVNGPGDWEIYKKTNKEKALQACQPLHPDAVEAYQIIMDDNEWAELYIPMHTNDELEGNLVQVDVPRDDNIVRHDDIN